MNLKTLFQSNCIFTTKQLLSFKRKIKRIMCVLCIWRGVFGCMFWLYVYRVNSFLQSWTRKMAIHLFDNNNNKSNCFSIKIALRMHLLRDCNLKLITISVRCIVVQCVWVVSSRCEMRTISHMDIVCEIVWEMVESIIFTSSSSLQKACIVMLAQHRKISHSSIALKIHVYIL